jgi:sulfoxide reductase heme-binding subunit YedZ
MNLLTMNLPLLRHPVIKPLVFTLCLLPMALVLWQVLVQNTSPDPAKTLVDATGLWALRLLWLCLLLTPLRLLTGDGGWVRLRRMLGLFAFFYATVHVLAYVFLLFGAEWGRLWHELAKRPYIMVGLAAWLLLVPLAITSTQGWQRRLRQRWAMLHRLVYVAAVLALTHFTWLQKLGITATWPYAVALALLLVIRIVYRSGRREG